MCWPCHSLATCPGCPLSLHQWQLRLASVLPWPFTGKVVRVWKSGWMDGWMEIYNQEDGQNSAIYPHRYQCSCVHSCISLLNCLFIRAPSTTFPPSPVFTSFNLSTSVISALISPLFQSRQWVVEEVNRLYMRIIICCVNLFVFSGGEESSLNWPRTASLFGRTSITKTYWGE